MPEAIDSASTLIRDALERLKADDDAPLIGYAGGASGGDILFHEICDELGIESWLLLAIPRESYMRKSVNDAGDAWIMRFNAIHSARVDADRVLYLQEGADLPAWLGDCEDYDLWRCSNVWTLMFGAALGPGRSRLLALWNGKKGDNIGGTKDMVELARAKGMDCEVLPAERLAKFAPRRSR